jgi:aspartate/methionine/tyrosine aminotransferase
MRDAAEYVSQRAHGVDASGIRKVFDLAAKLPDPINLSIGLPDFDVPDSIKAAAIAAIEGGQNRYTQTQGIAPLRERLRRDLSAEFGRDVGDVLITSGVSGALLLAMMAIIDPGDEVIFLDPYFVMYKHLLTLTGGVPVPVDSYPDFRFPADRVAAAVTPRTKAILLNSPSNPTGIVMTEAEVRAAVEVARAHGLLLISDEIYEPFLYDMPKGLPSAARRYENTLVLRGFSKSHAMTGWRLGYVAGPSAVVEQMAKLQQYTFVCAPSPLQLAAVTALDVPMDEAVDRYRRKRDIICDGLAAKFELVRPQGAFYVFPKAPVGRSATDFVATAIEHNVLVIPGNVFSGRDTHFRISYATSDDKLRQGVDVLNALA